MKDYDENKFYPFKRLPKKTNPFVINLSQNRFQNYKGQSKDSVNKNKNKFNPNKSELFPKLNIKNIQKNIIEDYEKDISDNRYNNARPSKEFYHRKNYFSRDFSNNKLLQNNSFISLNNKNNTVNKNYKKYNNKYHFRNSYESSDYSNKDNKKYNTNSKYSNSHSNNINSNTSYDFKKMKYTLPNNKEERRIPIIVVTKKLNKYKTSLNFFQKRTKIIRIQAAWRGYFLRKIAVGSIKKYIGFIALVKYLEKVFLKNIEFYFYEFLFLMKKFCEERINKYKYHKINDQDNKLRNSRYKKKMILNYNTNEDNNNNNYGHRAVKTNLYKTLDFESLGDKSQNNINNRDKIYNLKENLNVNNRNANKSKDKDTKNILLRSKKNLKNNDKAKNIIYIHKKVTGKSFKIKNKNYKIEKIVNLIRKEFYLQYYPAFLYKLKLIQKLNLIKLKLKTLHKVIHLIENKQLKKFLKKYRDNVINLTAKYEFFKNNNKKIQNNTLQKKEENESVNKEFNKIIGNNSNNIKKTINLDKKDLVEKNNDNNKIENDIINNNNDINIDKNKVDINKFMKLINTLAII